MIIYTRPPPNIRGALRSGFRGFVVGRRRGRRAAGLFEELVMGHDSPGGWWFPCLSCDCRIPKGAALAWTYWMAILNCRWRRASCTLECICFLPASRKDWVWDTDLLGDESQFPQEDRAATLVVTWIVSALRVSWPV